MKSLTAFFEEYFGKRAPALPIKARTTLTSIAPWIVLVFAIMSLPTIIPLFGLGSLLGDYAPIQETGAGYNISLLFSAIAVAMVLISLPGLFKKTKSGWNWLYYGSLVQTLGSLIAGNISGTLIVLMITVYLLFQVRKYYN